MYSNAKSRALIRDLSDKLSQRLAYSGVSMNSVRQGFSAADAAGGTWPYIAISQNGNEAEGQPVVLIQLANPDMVSKDVFGGDTDAYAPTIAQLGYELVGAAGTNPIPNHADLAAINYELQKLGCQLQLKELPNATAVTDASVNAAAPIIALDDIYWPTKGV